MTDLTLEDLSHSMRRIDICMMATRTAEGTLESRPMSNNRDVDYDGDSWFFANGDASVVRDLERDPEVCLSYERKHHRIYISITGRAQLIRDRAEMERHWVKDLDAWFEGGIDTPGLTLIHVRGGRMKYWNKFEEGEIVLDGAIAATPAPHTARTAMRV